jgi:hypothetical protein
MRSLPAGATGVVVRGEHADYVESRSWPVPPRSCASGAPSECGRRPVVAMERYRWMANFARQGRRHPPANSPCWSLSVDGQIGWQGSRYNDGSPRDRRERLTGEGAVRCVQHRPFPLLEEWYYARVLAVKYSRVAPEFTCFLVLFSRRADAPQETAVQSRPPPDGPSPRRKAQRLPANDDPAPAIRPCRTRRRQLCPRASTVARAR